MKETATQPGVVEPESGTDWESIERDYRAGLFSIREIARLHNVSDTAIRKKAKGDEKKGIAKWERDLTGKVKERVRAALVRESVRSLDAQTDLRTEREIVEGAAAIVVQVVREHRIGIASGRGVVSMLMNQLTDVAGKRDEFEAAIELETAEDKTMERRNKLMKAISIPAHAATVRDLSTAMKNLIGLERQAFNISGTAEDPPPDDGQTADTVRKDYIKLHERFTAISGKTTSTA